MNIRDEMLQHFDCCHLPPIVAGVWQMKLYLKKRDILFQLQDAFADLWESEDRERGMEFAVAALSPWWIYIWSLMFPTFHRSVIEWLWKRYSAAGIESVLVSIEDVA